MKHKTLFLLVLIFVFYSLSYANEIKEVLISPKIKLIKEESGEGVSRKIENKKILFLDTEGNIAKELELPRPGVFLTSTNKKLVATRKTMSRMSQEIVLYDDQGNMKQTFKVKPLGGVVFADDSSFVVFGYYPGDMPRAGSIVFYDSLGKENKEIKEIDGRDIFPASVKYSLDNERVIFIVPAGYKNDGSDNSSPVFLMCFDKSGNEKWRYNFIDLDRAGLYDEYSTYPFGHLEFSEDAKKIIVRGLSKTEDRRMTWVFDMEGNLLESKIGW